jgi:hypothetical protein
MSQDGVVGGGMVGRQNTASKETGLGRTEPGRSQRFQSSVQAGYQMVRYADDVVILCWTAEEAHRA